MLGHWLTKKERLLQATKMLDTPVYIYDTQVIKQKIDSLKKVFKALPFHIHYAMKANENEDILKFMRQQNIGVDAVSPNEIRRALSVGFKPKQIVYTPSCPSLEELSCAFDKDIHVHVGATEYFDFILKNYPDKAIGLRINPKNTIEGNQKIATAHNNSKFGIPTTQLEIIKSYLQKGLKVDSLHIHTGSDVKSWKDLARSVDAVFDFAKHFDDLKYIDLGSGFKVKYHPDDKEIDLQAYANYIEKRLKTFPYPVQLKFEPGKYLVSESGVFLVKVNIVKQGYNRKFVGVNSGFHHLIRPMYYDAYHQIVNLSNTEGKKEKYDIVGQLCEEDTFGYDRELNQVRSGDILMIMNAGAYGYSMASEYNLRDKPREIVW